MTSVVRRRARRPLEGPGGGETGQPTTSPGRSRQAPMAEHRIFVNPSRGLEVVNTDLLVEVQADGEKLGELRISRGSIDWVPRHHQHGTQLTWERFDRLMKEQANR